VLDASLLAIARTLGLDADRLMTVEALARFVGPFRRAIDGETSGSPLDIEMLGRPMLVSRGAGMKLGGMLSLTGRFECDSITKRTR
jgi:hypothetical protein